MVLRRIAFLLYVTTVSTSVVHANGIKVTHVEYRQELGEDDGLQRTIIAPTSAEKTAKNEKKNEKRREAQGR